MKIFKLTSIFMFLIFSNSFAQFQTLINRNGLKVNIQKSENKIFLGNITGYHRLLFTDNSFQNFDSIQINLINNQYIEDYYILNDTVFYLLINTGSYPRSIILKTIDSGNTWQTIISSTSNSSFTSIKMCDFNKGLITAYSRNNFSIINELKVFQTLDNWQTIDSTSIRIVNDFSSDFKILNYCTNNQYLLHSSDVLTYTNNFFESITNFQFSPFAFYRSGRIVNKDTLLFFTSNINFNSPYAKYFYSFDGGMSFNEKLIPTSNFSPEGAIHFKNGLFYLSTEMTGQPPAKLLISNDNFDTYDIINLPGTMGYPFLEFINDSVALLGRWGSLILKWDMNTYTSLNEKNIKQTLKIFPNPANDILNISLNPSNDFIQEIRIYDITSKLQQNEFLFPNNKIQLNISNLPLGMYVLSCTMKNGSIQNYKFVKAEYNDLGI